MTMITLPRLVRYSTTLVPKKEERAGQEQEEGARTRFNFKTTMKQAQIMYKHVGIQSTRTPHKKAKSVKSSSTFRL
jgi:hypothetical protein